jgi:hypothetical protein
MEEEPQAQELLPAALSAATGLGRTDWRSLLSLTR